MKNRYEQTEDGSFIIYAQREVSGKIQEGFEVPFYISKEDIERVDCIGSWAADYTDGPGRLPYIKGKYKNKDVRLHRWIMEGLNGEIAEGIFIDHLNRIPVDNRRENLRPATPRENANNTRKLTDKPSFDLNGLTAQAIVDVRKNDQVVDEVKITKELWHESCYVGSIFLGRYRPVESLKMNMEFNIAQCLLFEDLPRSEIYKRLCRFPMTEEQIKKSELNIMSINEIQALIDEHIANVLKTLYWKPTFLDA